MALLREAAINDRRVQQAGSMADAEGRETRIYLEGKLTEDVYGALARNARMVRPLETLLGGPVVHFHHKMMLKDPRVGGAWEWHQDYGYWYSDGFLFPLVASCMVAVDPAFAGNGCLQVLRGSHKLGRLDHGAVGKQTGADPARVAAAVESLETVYCEMEPGTALFFHGNTLHRSDANLSDAPRWAFISCYSAARNPIVGDTPWTPETPDIWPDERIEELATQPA
jgi:ectoine hydroxylase-related dioxygenase (phytanoyl-CoA dioxygenase family)